MCPPEEGLSFFLRDLELAADEELPKFQSAYPLRSEDLPAIWSVGDEDFLDVQLEIKPVPTAKPYGHLHWETPRPSEDQAERLALLATQRGMLLPFRPRAR